jgi:hypothetical protein
LRFVGQEVIADAFLMCELRKVDKTGCVRLDNKLFDVGIPLIGQKVDVVFDPADTGIITVEHRTTGFTKRVGELVVGPYAGKRPKLPDTLLLEPCVTSRLLDLKEGRFAKSQAAARRAIRYSAIESGGEFGV